MCFCFTVPVRYIIPLYVLLSDSQILMLWAGFFWNYFRWTTFCDPQVIQYYIFVYRIVLNINMAVIICKQMTCLMDYCVCFFSNLFYFSMSLILIPIYKSIFEYVNKYRISFAIACSKWLNSVFGKRIRTWKRKISHC